MWRLDHPTSCLLLLANKRCSLKAPPSMRESWRITCLKTKDPPPDWDLVYALRQNFTALPKLDFCSAYFICVWYNLILIPSFSTVLCAFSSHSSQVSCSLLFCSTIYICGSLLMRKVMDICRDFPPGSGSLPVTILWCGLSPWGATSAVEPLPCCLCGQVQGFSGSVNQCSVWQKKCASNYTSLPRASNSA